ncbi:hypothetical protein AB0K00_24100 [Dactylosporangium sp. NPDC049525]|uniref:hypothetical protein n=1 Tax=Dactylosporangium sp. NPDC049525 TaxID=3154730 RepID=UPI003422781A
MSEMPDIGLYRLHRRAAVADFEGTTVPGLRAEYLHREDGGRVASVGRYEYADTEILRAWGWTDESHCAYSAVRAADGSWCPPVAGCPAVELTRAGEDVTGLRVADGTGGWLVCEAGRITRR